MEQRQTDRIHQAERTWVPRRTHGAVAIAAVVASIILITLLAYSEVLDYFFTGMDSLTLVETGRLGSPSDLQRTMTKPLMDGTDFTRVLLYYRPLTSISYGLDYLVWGLNPLGYHVVDLALHAIVCVLVFFLASALAGGRLPAAWLSAVLFAAHPIHVEVVPAIANRQDVLASAFLMLSLITFIRYASAERRTNRLLYPSFVFYALALASKELAVLLPCLIPAYMLIFTRRKSLAGRITQSIKAVAGYAAVTAAWFAWRAYVLGGFGGYVGGMAGAAPTSRDLGHDALNYFLDLVYPLGNITARSVPIHIMFAVCLVFAASVAVSAVRAESAAWDGKQSASDKGGKRSGASKGRGGAAKGQDAGGNHGRYSGAADDRTGASKARATWAETSNERHGIGSSLAWLAIWLVVPLFVSLWTGTLSHRNMYFPGIALCVLISFVIVCSTSFFCDLLRGRAAPRSPVGFRLKVVNAFNLAFACTVAVSLLAFSPVLHGCSDWKAASNASSLLLEHLDGYAPTFQDGARLEFQDLPSRVSLEKHKTDDGRFRFYQAREMSVLSVWSLNSWLKLTHPEKNLEAVVLSRAEIRYLPVKVEFEVSQSPDRNSVKIRPVYYVIME